MIDILIPVLRRPHRAQPLIDNIRANTTLPVTILFLTTPGDHEQFKACARTGVNVLEVATHPREGEYATKINEGCRRTTNPWILCAADDLEFTPEWDTIALAVGEASRCGVVGTNDLANREVMKGTFSTHPLVLRSYVNQWGGSMDGPGIVYHQGYDHNYPDRELACVAQFRNEWAFAIESKIIHRHPGYNNPKADATYKKGMRAFQKDHLLFMRRSKQWNHVGLTRSELSHIGRLEPRKSRPRLPGTRRR